MINKPNFIINNNSGKYKRIDKANINSSELCLIYKLTKYLNNQI